jgi:hypothetical protein
MMGPHPMDPSPWRRNRARLRAAALAVLAVAFLGLAGLGCASSGRTVTPVPARVDSGLDRRADTLAYANQLRWEYDVDVAARPDRSAASGATGGEENRFHHRCALMARIVRQFHYGARFEPALPRPSDAELRALLARVLETDRRRESPLAEPVVIPGFANLRELSLAYGPELKEASGGGWRTWLQRGNWRMVFPFTPAQQRRTAESLVASLSRGHPPIVHVMNFPQVDLNHTLLLYRAESERGEIRFHAYDPNAPEAATVLRYDRTGARFLMPETPYFAGGPVKTYEVYDGLFF